MLTFKVQVEYKIGDIVYVRTDISQLKNIVSGYLCSEKDVQYELRVGDNIAYFYGFELSPDEDKLYKMDQA